ncbi:hypothetical protein [Fusobacterium vincentii ATCC 49256]|uniref:Uncharacterized protein n=1 Tax=Fusobacterium vincentii ATCC 49256 TaxID=209882 RepID=Q7P3T1_FUSVC|nr:hypothetical protein [Fusobacterium vincentii ATCC 49256]
MTLRSSIEEFDRGSDGIINLYLICAPRTLDKRGTYAEHICGSICTGEQCILR